MGEIVYDIVVDTDKLKSQAEILQSAVIRINKISQEISNLIHSINPSEHDGKLKRSVEGILDDANREAHNISNELIHLRDELNKKAEAFEAANNVMRTSANVMITALDIPADKRGLSDFFSGAATFFSGIGLGVFTLAGLGTIEDYSTINPIPPVIDKSSSVNNSSTVEEPQKTNITNHSQDNFNVAPTSKNNPTPVPLTDIKRINGESCVAYAKRRRGLDPPGGDGGADNYKNWPGVFKITKDDKDLNKYLAEGYVVIWDRDHPGLVGSDGQYWGHVAIVEHVEGDEIKISQANSPKDEDWVSIDQLRSSYVYILP